MSMAFSRVRSFIHKRHSHKPVTENFIRGYPILRAVLGDRTKLGDNNNNNFIKMATIAVELYNWHSKTTNDNK